MFAKNFFLLSFILIVPMLYSQSIQKLDSIVQSFAQKNLDDSAVYYAIKAKDLYLAENGEKDTLYADRLHQISEFLYSLHYSRRFKEAAIQYLNEERQIRKKLQGIHNMKYAFCTKRLGMYYYLNGDYDAAEPLFLEIKEIYGQVKSDPNGELGNAYVWLGIFYMNKGYYPAAEHYFIKSYDFFTRINFPHSCSNVASNLGNLYYTLGDYEKAKHYFQESLNILDSIHLNKHGDYATALNNVAIMYKLNGDMEKAKEMFIEALNVLGYYDGQKSWSQALLFNLADIYLIEGDYEKAEFYMNESANLVKESVGIHHPEYASSKGGLAKVYRNQIFSDSTTNQRTNNYKRVLEIYGNNLDIYKSSYSQNHPEYIQTLNNLATFHYELSNEKKAEKYIYQAMNKTVQRTKQNFSFLSNNEKEKYIRTQGYVFDNYFSISFEAAKKRKAKTKEFYNTVLFLKGLLLKSSTGLRNTIYQSNDSVLIGTYKDWIELKKEIAKTYATEASKREKNPKDLEEAARLKERELVSKSQDFKRLRDLNDLDWKSIRDEMKKGDAAIEFFHFRQFRKNRINIVQYCAIIIRANSKRPVLIPLFEEEVLSSLLNEVNRGSFYSAQELYEKGSVSEKLYKLIWEPLEPYLKNINSIYLSPSGLLHKISFPAMLNNKDLHLCDAYDISTVGTTASLVNHSNFKLNTEITAGIFGGVNYVTDSTQIVVWNFLEGSFSEANKINEFLQSQHIKTRLYSDTLASEEQFKQVSPNCEVLHAATHGFFYPSAQEEEHVVTLDAPLVFRAGNNNIGVSYFVNNKNPLLRTGIVLAGANDVWRNQYYDRKEDGVLTALEVATLDLRRTKLVVLSACETGLGDIRGTEGVYGLQRAFKMAGVDYLIMSLWQIPDKETEEFMTAFYKKLIKTKDIRTAFNQTQKQMREKYDPYYWAAFVLIE